MSDGPDECAREGSIEITQKQLASLMPGIGPSPSESAYTCRITPKPTWMRSVTAAAAASTTMLSG